MVMLNILFSGLTIVLSFPPPPPPRAFSHNVTTEAKIKT